MWSLRAGAGVSEMQWVSGWRLKVRAELGAQRAKLPGRPPSTELGAADNAPHQGGRNRKEKPGHVRK